MTVRGLALAGLVAAALASPGATAREQAPAVSVGTLSSHYLVGRHAERVNDMPTAAKHFEALVKAHPDDPALVARTQFLMAASGRFADAVALAERLTTLDRPTPASQLTLAIRDIRDGRFKAAAERLGGLDRRGANRLLVPLLRGWALAGTKAKDEALKEIAELSGVPGFEVIEGLHSALVAGLFGDVEAAQAGYARALAAAGDMPPLPLIEARAGFLAGIGKGQEALALVDGYIAASREKLPLAATRAALARGEKPTPQVAGAADGAADALHAIGGLLNREDVSASALVYVRMAQVLRPKSGRIALLLGQVLERLDRTDEAIAAFRSVEAGSPWHWFARLAVADGLQRKDDVDGSAALLRAMIAERPERADAARALGDLMRSRKRFPEAVSAYDMAVERTPEAARDWSLHYGRGIALERAKDWDRAEADFLRALELEPDQPLVLNYLGYSWVEKGQHLERARGMIEKAVAERPRDGYIVDSLGWVLYLLGDHDGAVVQLERAVGLVPDDPVINDHLGDLYWIVGRRNEARFQWQRALSQEPEDDVARKIRDKLAGRDLPAAKAAPQGRRDI
ncbi:MAG: tetratricopeptide repeat protein [Alphaproteobacteria bacterium]